jgi:hypothetical protein
MYDAVQLIPSSDVNRDFHMLHLKHVKPRGTAVWCEEQNLEFWTSDALESDGIQAPGMCMTLYATLNPKVRGTLFAVHFSGTKDGKALMRPITQDSITALFEDDGNIVDNIIEMGVGQVLKIAPKSTYPDTLPVVGELAKEFQTRRPLDTRLKPSAIYDVDHAPMKPAPLKRFKNAEGETVDPFANIAAKWGMIQPPLSEEALEILDLAYDITWAKIKDIPAQYPCPLTEDELLNTHLIYDKRSVDMNTSKGIYAKATYPGIGKRGCVEVYTTNTGDERKRFAPKFRENLYEYKEKFAQGMQLYFPCDTIAKDETLLNEKSDVGKTRGFQSSSIEMYMLTEEFMLPYNHSVNRCTKAGYYGGVNVFGKDLNDLVDSMSSFHNGKEPLDALVFAFDISKNDVMFNLETRQKSQQLVSEWTKRNCSISARDLIILDGLLYVNLYPRVCFENTMFIASGKLGSGEYVTFDINTGGNGLELTGTAVGLCIDNHVSVNPQNIDNIIKFAFYGDDSLIAPNFKKYPFFTAEAFAAKHMKLWNRELQMLDKNGTAVSSLKLRDAEFLSRGFKRINNNLFAPLRESANYSISNYYMDNGSGETAQTLEVAEAALREWFHHGPERFAQEKTRINGLLAKAGLPAIELTYLQLLADWTRSRA